MTTHGRSRLARRFDVLVDAHTKQLPEVAEHCHQLGLEMDALEERIVWLEERRLSRRLARARLWVLERWYGRKEIQAN